MRHSQKLKELERRRRRGVRLLAAGETQAEVARQVGVSRQTVMRWDRARQDGGMEALRRAPHFGRPERLSDAQRKELVRLLKEGALAAGFPTELWTLPRIAQLIESKFAVKMVASSVWRLHTHAHDIVHSFRLGSRIFTARNSCGAPVESPIRYKSYGLICPLLEFGRRHRDTEPSRTPLRHSHNQVNKV